MGRLEALKSYTRNGAYAAFEKTKKGSLAPGPSGRHYRPVEGYSAIPEDDIPGTVVVYTIVGGKDPLRAP